MAATHWMVVLLLGCSSLLQAADPPCVFPEIVQNQDGGHWATSGRAVTFSGMNMTSANVTWGLIGNDSVQTTCVKTMNITKHVYHVKDESGADSCLQFTQLTPNVIRLAKAGFEKGGCSKTWEAQDDVLVASERPRTPLPPGGCTLKGGFLFRSTEVTSHPNVKKVTCGQPVPSRLEADCLPGEGLLLSFINLPCVPAGTGWNTDQRLVCLDSWSEGRHNFTLLGTEYYNPQWCMRHSPDSTSLEIFSKQSCPPELVNGMKYISFNKTSTRTETECADDFGECTKKYCVAAYQDYCRKTCDMCPNEVATCDFNQDIVTSGVWLNAAQNTPVELSKSEVAFTDYTKFTCRQEVDSATYILQSATQQGCLPRFTCAKFSRLSPPVLRFKLSQSQLYVMDKGFMACEERQFTDDPPPVGSTYRSRLYKNMIATDGKLLSQTSACALRGNYSISGTILHKPCTGQISSLTGCDVTETMSLTTNCSHYGDLTCLGNISSSSADTDMMIVRPVNGNTTCWVLKRSGLDVQVTVVAPGQCNEDTPAQVQMGQTETKVVGQLTAIREDDCDVDNTSTTVRPETTTPPTTTAAATTKTSATTQTSTTTQTSATTTPSATTSEHTTETPATGTTSSLPTSSETTPTTGQPPPPPGPSGGEVVGIVFVVLLAVGLGIALAYFLWKRCHGRRPSSYSSLT